MSELSGEVDSGVSDHTTANMIPSSIGQVKFTQHEAIITMVQVPETCGEASDGKYAFKRASQQCIERLLAYPPATFHTELKGTNLAPHLHVILKSSALKALPLLSDIYKELSAQEQQDSVTVPFNPPCSVWSLVTVLLLLEGDVTIDGWLGTLEHDVALAARTLEMADFLRVSPLVQGIQEWLRGRLAVARSIGLSRKIWHNSQVLVAVPQRFCRSIFLGDRDPADSIRESIRLYAPVFCKWLQGSAPCLDLRRGNLHLLDWARLFALMHDVPEVVEIHVRGDVETPSVVSSPRSPMSQGQSSTTSPAPVDSAFTLSEGFLKAVQTAGQKAQLKHVRKIGFHNTSLHPEQMPAFEKAIATLQESLEVLTISSPEFASSLPGQRTFSAGDKWMFFRAVGRLSCLKSLRLPEALWKVLMSDGYDVAEPLWKLEGLIVEDCDTGSVLASANGGSHTSRSLRSTTSSRS